MLLLRQLLLYARQALAIGLHTTGVPHTDYTEAYFKSCIISSSVLSMFLMPVSGCHGSQVKILHT